jgi:microsomal epoxide hydrolase
MLELIKSKYKPTELPYHIIVPSLPGYGFSSKQPHDRNFRIEDIARQMDRFMIHLGFKSGYVAHGGDLGSDTARIMGAKNESCKGEDLDYYLVLECFC